MLYDGSPFMRDAAMLFDYCDAERFTQFGTSAKFIDAIAKRGLVFDNAYLTISSCSPSRCSIITGRYPHNTGAPELHTPLPPDQKTFIQELRRAGGRSRQAEGAQGKGG